MKHSEAEIVTSSEKYIKCLVLLFGEVVLDHWWAMLAKWQAHWTRNIWANSAKKILVNTQMVFQMQFWRQKWWTAIFWHFASMWSTRMSLTTFCYKACSNIKNIWIVQNIPDNHTYLSVKFTFVVLSLDVVEDLNLHTSKWEDRQSW